jgi:hypothetical protein
LQPHFYFVLSHLAWPILSLGCDTNRCQMTA